MSKHLFLFRGVPGSGKSTLAEAMVTFTDGNVEKSNFGVIVEVDHYFINEKGEYKFDASKIGQAHIWCRQMVKEYMAEGCEKIIVSNTSTQEWELIPYYAIAKDFGYTVFSLVVENRHGGVDVHNVPEETLVGMEARLRNSIKLR